MKPLIFYPNVWLPGCLLLLTHALHAQLPPPLAPPHMKPLAVGTQHQLHSTALGHIRQLNVYTPEGYDTLSPPRAFRGPVPHIPGQSTWPHLPVIYLLDGSANEDFLHIAGILQFMNMMELLPPHILAGIVNENRRYDFTHPTTNEADLKLIPKCGNSAAFISFIAEAQTYMDMYFWTNTDRTLIGQSLGGLLATEILLNRPQMFNRYIIVSPSLWWGNGALLASAAEKIKAWSPGQHPTEVYIAVGKEGAVMEKDAAKLAEVLKAANVKGMKVHFQEFPKETHATILHNAIYQTLLLIKNK